VQEIVGRLGPIARQLLECWVALPARDFVPDRRDFDPMTIVRILPVVSLLQRVGDAEWRFRLAGTEIERRWERRLTGMNYLGADILSPQVADAMRHEFRRIVERPCGSWSQRNVRFQSGRAAIIETLRLPLRADDGSVSLILSCSGELGDRITPSPDAPREIIQITRQRFFDVGAGDPGDSVLAATPEDAGGALPSADRDQRWSPSAPAGTS
jgi:hypothetical protein